MAGGLLGTAVGGGLLGNDLEDHIYPVRPRAWNMLEDQPWMGAGGPSMAGALRPGSARKSPIDPTQTGWTFKDVGYPNRVMERGDWRTVTRATDSGEGVMNVELPIRALTATQMTVNPDFSSVPGRDVYSGGEKAAPFVIKKGGVFYVQDGHHRLTAAAQRGQQTAKVRLLDLDNTTQTNFPLLDLMTGRQ